MSVIVFGSLNMDLVARTPKLPRPGETLLGHSFATVPGGKGANQAVAVARLGITTEFVGRVGDDAFGKTLVRGLQTDRVRCGHIQVDASTHSGIAMIAVDDASENNIIVIPGANSKMDETDVEHLRSILPQAKVLLLQLEIPLPIVLSAAKAAKQAGVMVILDPAPARSDLPAELYPLVDIITPNQVEASQLVGWAIDNEASVIQAAKALQQRGVPTVIIKRGKEGAIALTPTDTLKIPAFPVKAVDTVAAGDAFNGGLAASLAEGLSFQDAAILASAVAALSVSQSGAQASLPTREALNAFLQELSLQEK